MRHGIVLSAIAHFMAVAALIFGLPHLSKKPAPIPPPIAVEILPIAPKSNPRAGKKRVTKAKKPKAKVAETRKAQTKQKPAPKKVAKPRPKPEPKPVPKVASLPKPKPTKKPDPKPKPKKKASPPKPAPRVKAKPNLKPKPTAKPRKRMSLAQLLESAKKLKKKGKTTTREREATNERRGSPRHDPSLRLTMSELDALRRQLSRCWNFPAGAKNPETLIVEIEVVVNRDRTVRSARIVDLARMGRDPFFRSAAESALRAVLNPRCSPLKLPPDKYTLWKNMTVEFDPREMLGG